MRRLIILASMTLMASAVQAAEAGKVIFVAGAAQVVDRKAAEGDAVQEGELLQTGADGFIFRPFDRASLLDWVTPFVAAAEPAAA